MPSSPQPNARSGALPEALPGPEEIRRAVAEGFSAQRALTARLVAVPSVRGHEAQAQAILAEELAARGYDVVEVPTDTPALRAHPGAAPISEAASQVPSLVATHQPRQATGRSLILNGHIDVVPPGPEAMWTRPRWQATVEGDWMYGRGAGDMKAGLVANIAALDALRRLGWQPAAPVHLHSVVEEESTGNGALACLLAGYSAEAALIPEPQAETLVQANAGVLWFEVSVAGKPAHVRAAGEGANAIDAAARVAASLRGLVARWNAEAPQRRHFEDLSAPLSFNVGLIEGGDWPSTVAAWCRMGCRIGIYPDDDPALRAAEIERHLREDLAGDPFLGATPPQITWNGFFARGYVLEEGSEAEAALARAHGTVTGTALRRQTAPCYLDAQVFANYGGIPSLVYGPRAEAIHGFDERVDLVSLERVTRTIALFVAEWCGLEPVAG